MYKMTTELSTVSIIPRCPLLRGYTPFQLLLSPGIDCLFSINWKIGKRKSYRKLKMPYKKRQVSFFFASRFTFSFLAQNEELKTELELSLHLHEPRPSRIKNDIYDMREGEQDDVVWCHMTSSIIVELNNHEERLSKHIRGLSNVLHERRDSVSKLWDVLDERVILYWLLFFHLHSLRYLIVQVILQC